MESQNLDNQFRKIVESSDNHYNMYSDSAKGYIWNQIQRKDTKTVAAFWKPLALAASALCLVSLLVGFFYSKRHNSATIANLNQQIEWLKQGAVAQNQNPDTICKIVTVTKERIVKVPVITRVVEEKIQIIRDTVLVAQIVTEYRDKEVNNQLITQNTPVTGSKNNPKITSTEIILSEPSSTVTIKKEKNSIGKFLQENYLQNSTSSLGPFSLKDLLSRL